MTSYPEANPDTPQNVAETMRDVMIKFGEIEHICAGSREDVLTRTSHVAVPNGRTIHDMTEAHRRAAEYLRPARRRGTARLKDLDSLVAWANRFKGAESALFAQPDMRAPTLTCIADYHAGGAPDQENSEGEATARHCHHRAVYDFPLSDEWKAWMAVSNGDPLEKDALGEFIEAQAKDIMDPTPPLIRLEEAEANQPWENRLIQTARKIEGRYGQLTQLLAMSKRFQVYETSDLKVSTNRDTGEAEIQFLNEHKGPDGQPLNIPNLIIIAIPVFLGGAPYRMPVRFRYRKMGSTVRFILSVYNPERAFEAAFDEALAAATEATGLPLFKGAPEA